MTSRRRWLLIVALVLAPFVSCVIWAVATTLLARHDTPRLLAQARSRFPIVLPLGALSMWQHDALLRVEDPSFYQHHGVDLATPGQGLTTITQALVKRIYFERFRPGLFSKIRQSLIARYALDPALCKSDQLELFINLVFLGEVDGKPIHGLEQAAERYHGKAVATLDQTEYLSLIAMINSPDGFHLRRRPAVNAERVRRIQKLLAGEYKPKALRDMYYGPLDAETQSYLAPASYQPSLY